MNDSRFEQWQDCIKAAQAALDDGRCIAADIADESPDMNPLDVADFRLARSNNVRSLMKANSANAALARITDRAARAEKVTAGEYIR